MTRSLVSSTLIAGVLIALPALPARAEPTSMSALDGVFTGTPGADTLIIGRDGGNLTNNGFALGAPGFVSDLDFDSAVEGVQLRRVPNQIDYQIMVKVYLGDGDDTLAMTGAFEPFVDQPLSEADLGAGTDVLDLSGMTTAAKIDSNVAMETIEKVIGTVYDDRILANPNTPRSSSLTVFAGAGNDYVIGTSAADYIYGGGGTDRIASKGGDDTIVVSAPLPVSMLELDGGAGNDTLVMQGSTGNDNLELAGYPSNFWAFNLENFESGYHAVNVERARLDLGEGDDFAFLSESLAIAGVVGGPGNDQVIVDAFKSTANISTVGSLKRIAIPLANRTPIVNLSGVEQYAIANETLIGTAPTPGGGPHVRTFRIDGTNLANFYAYDSAFTGGVTLGLGDLDGDADDEIITAAGPGGGPHVRVFYSDGTDTGTSFYAYDPSFNGGVSVAAIDLDGDGFDEIVTAPAKNSQPLVRVFDFNGEMIAEWVAEGFGNSGLNVARGARMGQYGGEEILLSAAGGEQSVVRAFEADGTPSPQYDAYAPYGGFAGGASVSRGEFAGGGNILVSDEIITGAGTGGGPVVRVVQRAATGRTLSTIGNFFAYDPAYTGGVEVSACNPDGGNDEIVTVPARNYAPLVRIFNLDGSVKRRGFMAYGTNFTNGIHVVCGGAMSRFFGTSAQSAQRMSAQMVSAQSVAPTGRSQAAFAAK